MTPPDSQPTQKYRIRVRGDWSKASFSQARGLLLESVDSAGSAPITVFSADLPNEVELSKVLDALHELAVEVVGVRPVDDEPETIQ